WRVSGLTPGCEILADNEFVVLVPPVPKDDLQDAHLFRVTDGSFIGTHRLPSTIVRQRHGADWGRMFLTITRQPGERRVTMAMYDPVRETNVWERTFEDHPLWTPLDGFDLVVLSETGRLSLINALTGDVRCERDTAIPADVKSLAAVGHPHEWFVFTERSQPQQPQVNLLPPNAAGEYHLVNGPAIAFDRRTHEPLWTRELTSLRVDPSLPSRWPILVLSSEAWSTPVDGRRPSRFQNLMLLNKRTGEVVYEGDGDGPWQGTSWTLSPEPPQIELSIGRTGLAVTFREEPVASDGTKADVPNAAASPSPPPPPERRIPAPPRPAQPDPDEK
ncbi:MAG: hypothetical protein KF861_06155, partial [Planctomycetaceae bacterium]|nr:hypothetical protein [Planctomycetaceae bacterium]